MPYIQKKKKFIEQLHNNVLCHKDILGEYG